MTAKEIADRIDEALAAFREHMGNVPSGKLLVSVYEGDDGLFVTTQVMTSLEMYEVEKLLFGQEVADYNFTCLQKGSNQ